MVKLKDIKPHVRRVDFIRWTLTLPWLYLCYRETGIYTGLLLAAIALNLERGVILERLKATRDKNFLELLTILSEGYK